MTGQVTMSGDVASASVPAAGRDRALPGLWRASAVRSVVELKSFFRNRQSVFFTLLLPVLLLVVLGAIFPQDVAGTRVSFRLVLISGIIGAGIMSVGFSGLAINLSIERDNGTLRRLAAAPMPRSAYFVGKIVRVVVTAIIETAVLLVVAVLFFHLSLPHSASRWLIFGWVLVLGTAACALLGVTYSSFIPNSRSAAAIVTPPFLVLQFISGVFLPFNQLPQWMRTLASFFPLKWMAQGMSSVFLPNSFTIVEPAHSWETGRTALILVAWIIAGAALSVLTFSWRGARVR